jgi:hypothetical protein
LGLESTILGTLGQEKRTFEFWYSRGTLFKTYQEKIGLVKEFVISQLLVKEILWGLLEWVRVICLKMSCRGLDI